MSAGDSNGYASIVHATIASLRNRPYKASIGRCFVLRVCVSVCCLGNTFQSNRYLMEPFYSRFFYSGFFVCCKRRRKREYFLCTIWFWLKKQIHSLADSGSKTLSNTANIIWKSGLVYSQPARLPVHVINFFSQISPPSAHYGSSVRRLTLTWRVDS